MIELDVSCCWQSQLSQVGDQVRGLDQTAALQSLQPKMAQLVQDLWRRSEDPKDWVGWLQLADQEPVLKAIETYAQSQFPRVEHLIIAGIGGSSLGIQAMVESLLPAYWNERHHVARGDRPKVYFVDNVDPVKLNDLLEVVDLNTTLVNVITKSGSTAETMAAFLWLKGLLEDRFGKTQLPNQLVITTDPSQGALRKIAQAEGLVAFDIPPSVGGRFSVFTPVGLLPAALLGIDIRAMIKGLQDLNPLLKDTDPLKNPAALGAMVQYGLYRQGQTLSVFMPYAANMMYTADWYVQLWAESLGKRYGLDQQEVFAGSTPIRGVGVTDQHAQVQLFNEGPFDKVVTFVRLKQRPVEVAIPDLYPAENQLNYLGQVGFGALLEAEAEATRASLARNGRPSMTYWLPQLDAYHFAQLLYVLEMQTALMGGLLGIDPFDQPGVELGKQYTYALMGRPGYEALKAEVKGLQPA